MYKKLAKTILCILYPSRCALCDSFINSTENVCASCYSECHFFSGNFAPVSLKKVWFRQARSCVAYNGKLIDAIWGFKYQERFDLLPFFTNLLTAEASKMSQYDMIIPVPLHKKRLGSRGFNQSILLGNSLSKQMKIPLKRQLLRRTLRGDVQVGKKAVQRMEQVRSAFAVSKPADVRAKRILLLDDVIATGATVNECAKALIKAKAQFVDVLTIARPL